MPRELKIIPVLNGFVVQAGCQTVVFNSAEQLATELAAYYANPKLVEERYLKQAVNKVDGSLGGVQLREGQDLAQAVPSAEPRPETRNPNVTTPPPGPRA